MPAEELGFKVIARFLKKCFDRRHFPTFLGDLETIGNTDQATAFPHGIEVLQTQTDPHFGEGIQHQSLAMKQMQQPPIGLWNQPPSANEAGHASKIGTNR
jgi:hypothetical protein